jgi:acyl-CoA reductase-like NAD-dependent aldehyde dehydrogenase
MATTIKTQKMSIGGSWTDSSSGETAPDINPATGETITETQRGTKEDAEIAVAASKKAYYGGWRDTTPAERSAMLLKLADAVEANGDELAELESAGVVSEPVGLAEAERILARHKGNLRRVFADLT